MKKAVTVLGIIAGIIGALNSGLLLLNGLNMKVTDPNVNAIVTVSVVGLLLQIMGMVCSLLSYKKPKILGMLIILAGLSSGGVAWYSIPADSPISFIGGGIVGLLFIIAGIIAMTQKKEVTI